MQTLHGGDIYSFAKRLDIKPKDVIDFSSNINQYKPRIDIDFNKLDISSYHESTYQKLKKKLAKKYQCKMENIALFNGASSAIRTLLEESSHTTLYAPLYGEYKRFAKNYELINRFDNLYKKPKPFSTVVFVNPSTPDGRYYDLKRLFKIWKERKNRVIIDESFLDFTSFSSDFFESANLYIIKSLTKFYSCAGVRIGVVLSAKESIKGLEDKIPAWNISTFDEAYILSALKERDFVKKSFKKIKKDKRYLKKILKKSSYVEKIYKSNVNFFLLKTTIKAFEFQRLCDKEAILIRDCSNFDFLDEYHIRIAVRRKKDIKRLMRCILS